ncbi:hypothetical protein [uncultured Sphaerochaeta sp.]|uniref:hypothetical protein n=1 Tax=uncultured Sphaerochaeta sp. TaxID=886478 RepID=UPI002A0A987E|nr:hypothetical protein [uncultured Sphaerochaeta sp.]
MFHTKQIKILAMFLFLILVMVVLTSCLPGTLAQQDLKPAGFLMGVWHGWIAPFSLIISIFRPDVRLYDSYNTGWWYDFGFYIAIISGFGGLSLFRKTSANRNPR